MKPLSLKLILVLTITLALKCYSQNVSINEFVSSNNSLIYDSFNATPDYIELYNPSNNSVNLVNFYLSDDTLNYHKWSFPDTILNPKSFLLVFASGNDTVINNEIHTNFKIASAGEYLVLSNSSNKLIDSIGPIQSAENEVFGRYPDGESEIFSLSAATPGYKNSIYSISLNLSHKPGFYSTAFSLKISSFETGNFDIRYTLNGNEPTANDQVYSNGININFSNEKQKYLYEIPTSTNQDSISNKAWELPHGLVKTITTVRCAAFKNSQKISKTYTATFIVDSEGKNCHSLPLVSLSTNSEHFFSDTNGIYVPGINFNPEKPERSGNFFETGSNWERPIHIEYFTTDGELAFAQNAGVRINGGITRQAAQKSLRFYARESYGSKQFNYPLFPNRPFTSYKRFILRATMGAKQGQTIFADALAHNIIANLNVEWQDSRPVVVYLNGEYWGIHTIRERIDERFIEYLHGISKDSVIIDQLYYGTSFWEIKEDILNLDLSENENYTYFKSIVDIDNLIDYHIAEMFFRNIDWPRFNNQWWRPSSSNGKWRYIFFDVDAGYGKPEYNMYTHLTRNIENEWPYFPDAALFFRKLIKNDEFVSKFITRYAYLLENDFNTEQTIQKYNRFKEMYQPEVAKHSNRWNYPNSADSWEHDAEKNIRDFLLFRSCNISENTQAFFNLLSFGKTCNEEMQKRDLDFVVFPNPSSGTIFLKNTRTEDLTISVELFNAFAHKIYQSENLLIPAASVSTAINLKAYKRGLYVVRIKCNNYYENYKLLIN